MQLDADFTLQLTTGSVVVDQHAHDMAVDQLYKRVTAGDDMNVVPVVVLDKGSELIAIADLSNRSRLFASQDIRDLSSHGQKTSGSFFIDLTRKRLMKIDVGLISLHYPLRNVRPFNAPVLNTTVPVC